MDGVEYTDLNMDLSHSLSIPRIQFIINSSVHSIVDRKSLADNGS